MAISEKSKKKYQKDMYVWYQKVRCDKMTLIKEL